MSTDRGESRARALAIIQEQFSSAVAASKCHRCGCLHNAVEALEGTEAGRDELAPVLSAIRRVFQPKEYDCLGCPVCYPAVAANAFTEAFPREGASLDLCPTDEPSERHGWPPLPGDYRVLRYRAPVAICTLNSSGVTGQIAARSPEGVALVGTLHTENLGIERIIRNVLANPHIRFLLVCGEDTRQAIGHLPGQSLISLFENGLDERGRIIGARGKRPVLKNVRREQVETFRRQIEVVPIVGEESAAVILGRVSDCAARNPGAREDHLADVEVPVVAAQEPLRLVPDPAGFFVVYPDGPRRRVILEHYSTDGVLDCVIEGESPSALYATAIERGLLSRLDHAAYLGRELARAHRTIETGEPYVQDRAPGELASIRTETSAAPCGCEVTCSVEQAT
jgi:tetrahydromethanopterin S-methyltransferase subunit A